MDLCPAVYCRIQQILVESCTVEHVIGLVEVNIHLLPVWRHHLECLDLGDDERGGYMDELLDRIRQNASAGHRPAAGGMLLEDMDIIMFLLGRIEASCRPRTDD